MNSKDPRWLYGVPIVIAFLFVQNWIGLVMAKTYTFEIWPPESLVIELTSHSQVYTPTTPTEAIRPQEIDTKERPVKGQSPPWVKDFIIGVALDNGVDPELALFIVEKESQFNYLAVGDTHLKCKNGETMRSRGLWQVSNCFHDLSDEASFSITSSTLWAMPYLRENPGMWSTYKLWKSK